MATAEVSEPPRPSVVIRPVSLWVPWKPAMTATSLRSLALDQFLAIDVEDAGRRGRQGQDWRCQPLPRRAVTPIACQRDGEQPRGDLLARRHHGVVFAGIVNHRRIAAPLRQPVGGPGHCRDDDRDFMAGIDLALDVARHIADVLDVGHRGSTELHHQASHPAPPLSWLAGAAAKMREPRREMARIHTGEVPPPQRRDPADLGKA